jgi:cation transport protein ChaC
MADAHDLWVFAYGSLMWRPGFAYTGATHARLVGWRRSFCIYSHHYRGSQRRPGLVLGLDRGGTCEGIAFRVPPENAAGTLRYLRAREQVIPVYREALVPVTLMTGERAEVMALAFLVERAHPSYAGALPLARQMQLIRGAAGQAGSNIDYLVSTLAHLGELGIRERELERLLGLVGAHLARGEAEDHVRPGARALMQACGRHPVRAPRFRPEDSHRFSYRNVFTARQ